MEHSFRTYPVIFCQFLLPKSGIRTKRFQERPLAYKNMPLPKEVKCKSRELGRRKRIFVDLSKVKEGSQISNRTDRAKF